jgi:hypothetical protein
MELELEFHDIALVFGAAPPWGAAKMEAESRSRLRSDS